MLSIVVPTHDVAPWIRECLTSILRQPVENMEVLVVDDHSSDDTISIIESIRATDSRITLINAIEDGGANARNLGVSLSRGKYLMFADGDDIVPDDAYRHLFDSLERTGSDIAVGRFLKFSTRDTWDPSPRWGIFDEYAAGVSLASHPRLIRGRACWNKMFVRDFWQGQKLMFPEVVRSNDVAPMTAAILNARGIDLIPNFVYLYRSRPGTQSMTARASRAAAMRSYLEQELFCVRLLIRNGAERALYEYFSLFLNADGWVHVSGFVRAAGGRFEVDEDLVFAAEALAHIIALVPADVWYRLNPGRRRIFRLLSSQRWEVLRHLDPEGNISLSGEEAMPVELERVEEAARAIVDLLPINERPMLAEGLQARVLQPLIRDASEMDESELAELGLGIENYRAAYLENVAFEFSVAERIALELCEAGRGGDIARLSTLVSDSEISTTSVSHDGVRLRVEVLAPATAASRNLVVIAKPRLRGDVIQGSAVGSGDSPDDPARFTFEFDRSQFVGHNLWDLFAVVSDDDLEIETPLTLGHVMRQSPDGRRSTFHVNPVKKAGAGLVIAQRPAVAVRAAKRLRARLRPNA